VKTPALLVLALAISACFVSASARANHVPPGSYTWAQATALGVHGVEDYVKPDPSVPDCPPPDPNYQGEVSDPPDDGPECYSRPEDQGLIFVVPGGANDAVSQLESITEPGIDRHKHNGSFTSNFVFKGGRNLAEISDPSICQSACDTFQFFYSRIAGYTYVGNGFEIGWIERGLELNGGDQVVSTVTERAGYPQDRQFHTEFNLPVGFERAFRLKQCPGDPIDRLAVCMEILENGTWEIVRPWYNVMRCRNSDGSGHCRFNFYQEAYAENGAAWFNLVGGSDGLRMHNILVWYGSWGWRLFDSDAFTGEWRSESPYSICQVNSWYNFTAFRGPPSC